MSADRDVSSFLFLVISLHLPVVNMGRLGRAGMVGCIGTRYSLFQ